MGFPHDSPWTLAPWGIQQAIGLIHSVTMQLNSIAQAALTRWLNVQVPEFNSQDSICIHNFLIHYMGPRWFMNDLFECVLAFGDMLANCFLRKPHCNLLISCCVLDVHVLMPVCWVHMVTIILMFTATPMAP